MDISILVITYNHENFIERCLKSIINQNFNGTFEVLIGEDNSTDNTKKIIKKTIKNLKNYKIITPDQSKRIDLCNNKNGRHNIINLLNKSVGDYIAILDGDDYWYCPNKLHNQLNMLKKFKADFSCQSLNLEGYISSKLLYKQRSQDIITSSIVAHKDIFKNFLKVSKFTPVGDLIWQLSSVKGVIIINNTTHYEINNIYSWTNTRKVKSKSYWRCYYKNMYKTFIILFLNDFNYKWLYAIIINLKEQFQNGRFY